MAWVTRMMGLVMGSGSGSDSSCGCGCWGVAVGEWRVEGGGWWSEDGSEDASAGAAVERRATKCVFTCSPGRVMVMV